MTTDKTPEPKVPALSDDVMAIGDSLKVDTGSNGKAAEPVVKADVKAPEVKPDVRRRVGSAKVKTARERFAAGTASDSDLELIKADDDRKKDRATSEAPPSPASARAASGSSPAWLSKYGGDVEGRELVCLELAEQIQNGTYALSKFIKDNGGTPVIDYENEETGKRWFNNNVRAMHALLPPNVNAAPELMLLLGGGALTVQGAITAYKVKKAKKLETKAGEEAVKKAGTATAAIAADAPKPDSGIGEVSTEEIVKVRAKPVRERTTV